MKKSYLERLVLSEDEACQYVKYILENFFHWEDVSYKKYECLNEYVFNGYIYVNGKEKVLKILNNYEFVKFLKAGIEIKKGINISYINSGECKGSSNIKYIVSYALTNEYVRSRRR